MTFRPGESEKSIQVPIINDLSREESEMFYGSLMISYQSDLLWQFARASIQILINDCKNIACSGIPLASMDVGPINHRKK